MKARGLTVSVVRQNYQARGWGIAAEYPAIIVCIATVCIGHGALLGWASSIECAQRQAIQHIHREQLILILRPAGS